MARFKGGHTIEIKEITVTENNIYMLVLNITLFKGFVGQSIFMA